MYQLRLESDASSKIILQYVMTLYISVKWKYLYVHNWNIIFNIGRVQTC